MFPSLYLQKPATAEQKAWIVRQMDSSNETSYSLARKLGCSSSYIRKIMFRSRHVSDVKKPVGRPKTLDAESMAILQESSSNRYINMIGQVLSVVHLSVTRPIDNLL